MIVKNILKKISKKLIISISILLLAIIFIITLLHTNNNFNSYLNKINLLVDKYDLLNEQIDGIAISISNGKETAKTFFALNDNSVTNDIETNNKELLNKLNIEIKKYISANNYKSNWIKINLLKNKTIYSIVNLYNDKLNFGTNKYPYGLIFENKTDNNKSNKTILLSEYLNSHALIDELNTSDKDIFENQLNDFFEENKIDFSINLNSSNIYKVDQEGYFIDENNNMYKTEYSESTLNRRTDYNDKNELGKEIVTKATNYLFNLIQDDGSFDYQYDMALDEKVDEYNIIRHAGSLWSVLKNYESLENKNQKTITILQTSIDYLLDYVFYYNKEAYAKNDDEYYTLGASALISCALTDFYTNVYEEKEVYLLSKKLCDGMIALQDEVTGSIPHKLNPNFELVKEYSTDYYDGEACLALLKMYDLSKEEKYLNAALKLMDEFYLDNEETYYNHWFSYCILYLAENNIDIDNYNLNKNIKQINNTAKKYLNRNSNSHVAFEYLSNSLNFYNIMIKNGKENLVKDIDIEILKNAVDVMYENQVNTFIFPEQAMYYKNPKHALNSFINTSDQRLRIDDIQHSILGFNDYLNLNN